MLKQAEYVDVEKITNIISNCDMKKHYVKYDFNINDLNTEEIRTYIFDFRILFLYEEDNLLIVKNPESSERNDLIEILLFNKESNILYEGIQFLKDLSKEFGWKVLRIVLVNDQVTLEYEEIIKKAKFKRVASYFKNEKKLKKEIYEIEF